MASKTEKGSFTVHGTNAQFLVEKILRSRIYESLYWKEQCFALTAETLIDKAVGLDHIGGQTAMLMPTQFMCLVLKLLQIQPSRDIILQYIQNEDFKYLRALGAFYFRLVGSAVDIYRYLEPLLNDYRKLRMRHTGGTVLTYVDEFVDQLLNEERVCDVILPRLAKRYVLEENDELEPRISVLEEMLEDQNSDQEHDEVDDASSSEGDVTSPLKSTVVEQIQEIEKDSIQLPAITDTNGHNGVSKVLESSEHPSDAHNQPRDSKYSTDRRSTDIYDDRHPRNYNRYRSRSRSYSRNRDRDRDRDRERDRRHYDDNHRRSERHTRSRSRSRHYANDRRTRDNSNSRYGDNDRHQVLTRSRSSSRDKKRQRTEMELNDRKLNTHSMDNSIVQTIPTHSDVPPEKDEGKESKKPGYSKRKVDRLFKKSAKHSTPDSIDESRAYNDDSGGGAKESLSVDETNKMRASLGLAPLK